MSARHILHVDTGRLLRGGQRQVLLLMHALRERGWENVLAAPPEATLARHARAADFECLPFNPRNDMDLLAAAQLGLQARQRDLGLWHAHSARAHGVARLGLAWPPGARGRKLVVTRRTAFGDRTGRFHRLKYRDPRVERYIAISEAVAQGLRRAGVSTSRIRLVPSAVEAERFADSARFHLDEAPAPAGFDPTLRERTRAELGIPPDGFLVGAAGALDRSKGYDLMLAAASRACLEDPCLYFVVAGEGPQRRELESDLRSHGLGGQFRLLGRRKDLPRLFCALDLFCMPSREEGLGSAVLEAFAAGLPVIASDAGGLAELLQPGRTGHRVPRNDTDALAKAFVDVARNPGPARAMALTAWAGARDHFSPNRMAEAVERIYHSLESNGDSRRAAASAGG